MGQINFVVNSNLKIVSRHVDNVFERGRFQEHAYKLFYTAVKTLLQEQKSICLVDGVYRASLN